MRLCRDDARDSFKCEEKKQSYRQVVLRLAKVRICEVLFLELVFLCTFMTCLGCINKALCFEVRVPQFYDVLRLHGEAPTFRIVVQAALRRSIVIRKSLVLRPLLLRQQYHLVCQPRTQAVDVEVRAIFKNVYYTSLLQ